MYMGSVSRHKVYGRYYRRKNRQWGMQVWVMFLLAFSVSCFIGALVIAMYGAGGYLSINLPGEPIDPNQLFIKSVSDGDGENKVEMHQELREDSLNVTNATEMNATENNATVTNVTETDVPKEDRDVIMIDPGHGGDDEGCGRGDVLEKEINLQIAYILQDKLTQMGYEVILTRREDVYISLEERVEIANSSNADIFISIHQNAYEGTEAMGMETWYSSEASGKDSGRLAKLIHQNLVEETECEDRGICEDEELKVIREVKMSACLVETGFLSNFKERALLTDAEYQAKIAEGIAEGVELYFHPKTMYLTFDDGPTAENTCMVLDILKEKNIKATFFVIGESVRKNPEVARRIVAEGHSIGIHCNNHDYDMLYESVDSYLADFQEAYDIVYEVTGVEAKMYRFPGGSINAYNKAVYEEIIAEMTERGFVYYDWNASLEDAVRKSSPEQLLQTAKDSTLERKKVIMLAHDTVHNTALCLEGLIEQFPEYRMEPLSIEVEPIQF